MAPEYQVWIEPSGEAGRPDFLILLWFTEKFAGAGYPRLSITCSFKRQRHERANYSGLNLLFDSLFLAGTFAGRLPPGGNEMKHQLHIGTESGIVSREAVRQIRILIADLARTLRNLDADIVVGEMRPRAHDPASRALDMRRHNLVVTIASLEDRLESIEKVRSRGYGGQANSTFPRIRAASDRSMGSRTPEFCSAAGIR